MPTPVSHLAVGFAVAAWTQPAAPSWRVCTMAALCAALPDIDVLSSALPIPHPSLLDHRAITHSLAFAVVAAVVATSLFFRKAPWAQSRLQIGFVLGVASLSHGCLDALSTYSYGVEFFAPFSQQRFRFLWTPLGNPHWSLAAQFGQEAVCVLLPAVLLAWSALKVRRDRVSSGPAAA